MGAVIGFEMVVMRPEREEGKVMKTQFARNNLAQPQKNVFFYVGGFFVHLSHGYSTSLIICVNEELTQEWNCCLKYVHFCN